MIESFYSHVEPVVRFADITDPRHFVPVPASWHLVIADIKGSTQAIAAGRYKEVNMVGASVIAALLNVAGPIEIPFIFGGDGATLAIPPDLLAPTRTTLAMLQALARRSFGLELRVGLVPVADLLAMGRQVRVARLAISEQYAQAVFSGGVAYAEGLIKDPAGSPYLVTDEDIALPNLNGLECRWQDIPSRYGETVSLLVMVAPDQPAEQAATILGNVIAEIERWFGGEQDYHPLAPDQLKPTISPWRLLAETRMRAGGGVWAQLRYLLRIWGLNLGVVLYQHYQQLAGRGVWWDQYRDLVFRTADYRKYDDTLRMLVTGAPHQRVGLEHYLEGCYQRGELVYGLHVADRALMTCLVFERMGRQVHFVDGADGGYALAARAMKERLAAWPAALSG